MTQNWDDPATRDFLTRALQEDIGAGDLTSLACVSKLSQARGVFQAKQDLVVAGIELLPILYPSFNILAPSGSAAQSGDVLAEVGGPARQLLAHERVTLNVLCRLCGIATLTRQFVEAVAGTNLAIHDPRKTTPGKRRLEKMAVAAGGGVNHRMGLYDAVLIKENHVQAAGGIRQALEAVHEKAPEGVAVEIEVRIIDELMEALEAGAKSLLLDNFTPAAVSQAVDLVQGRARVEVSGGVNLENVRAFAQAGPDAISVGALTHSAPAADITFLLSEIQAQ